ncbi:hypothetical protein AJ79_04254 [Helicocarpus griseus UAMH5409]|uniref:Uncharacterized protein n=1 Tax=Helicocarpus griseus UAMH5409 TaxID=1447875 RepID=A0A2B7XU42_9EURO|nr:hypothetical protein AJ79_04254 [Helicocarpus griseus UAMH5409]
MLLSSLALLSLFAGRGLGYRVTPGSPCESICLRPSRNTTADGIVCSDDDFSSPPGTYFQECVKCLLRSPYFIRVGFEDSESDVEWGLYNLRYAVSSCIFGYPEEKLKGYSTPCQVTCELLRPAFGLNLLDPGVRNMYDHCGMGAFDDGVIDQCAFCFNMTESERYIGNFVEAVRDGCHAKVPDNVSFPVDPNRIFDVEPLPPTTDFPKLIPPGQEKPKMKNLILIIVFPILGFLFLLACASGACVFFILRRRRTAKRKSQPNHLHERWNDTGIMTPVDNKQLHRSWGEPSPYPPEITGSYPGYPKQEYTSPSGSQQDIKYPPDVKCQSETYAGESNSSSSATPQLATVLSRNGNGSPQLSSTPKRKPSNE